MVHTTKNLSSILGREARNASRGTTQISRQSGTLALTSISLSCNVEITVRTTKMSLET